VRGSSIGTHSPGARSGSIVDLAMKRDSFGL